MSGEHLHRKWTEAQIKQQIFTLFVCISSLPMRVAYNTIQGLDMMYGKSCFRGVLGMNSSQYIVLTNL